MHRRLAFSRFPAIEIPSQATSASDGEMLRALRNGETTMWQTWLANHSPRFYNYVIHHTHTEVDAQQLLHAVLSLVTQTILHSESPFEPTILTVSAIYQALMRYQNRCGAPKKPPRHLQPLSDPEQDQFLLLLRQLSVVERHIVLLRYLVGLDLDGVATVTGYSTSRIVAILQRAKQHFGSLLT